MFDMDYKNIVSFFVLFVLRETLSSESVIILYEYDVTKLLDQWFAKIFQIDVEIADEVRKSFDHAEYYKLADVEYNLDHEVRPFGNKFIFQDVNFYMHDEDMFGTSSISQMSCNFLDNKVSVFMEKVRITLESELRLEHNSPYVTLFTTLNFRNFTLSATLPSKNNKKTLIDITYDRFFVRNYGSDEDIKWSGRQYLSHKNKALLSREVKPALVAMLIAHIKRNDQFSRAFNSLLRITSKTKVDIISMHPDFLKQEQKYYYLIPKIIFYRFSLKSIRIKGLPKIESLSVDTQADIFTHTLLVKSIRGNMFLDYGNVEGAPQPLELNFEAYHLIISTRRKNCVHVEARYYNVNSTTGPITHRQATVIMEKIESALVSSIMPSKKAWRLCDKETPIDKLKTSDASDWETIKETYKNWIPFN